MARERCLGELLGVGQAEMEVKWENGGFGVEVFDVGVSDTTSDRTKDSVLDDL